MITTFGALGRLLKEKMAKAWVVLARRDDPYPRLQTCCQLERMKDAWRARL